MVGVELAGRALAEALRERGLEVFPGRVVCRPDRSQLFVPEASCPGAVVESLGNDLTWGSVALELDHVDIALRVESEKVDERAMARRHLTADYQQDV